MLYALVRCRYGALHGRDELLRHKRCADSYIIPRSSGGCDVSVHGWDNAARTPHAIVLQLNAEITRLLRLPEVKQRLAPLGTEPAASAPEAFDKLIADEVASFTRIARAANIKVE